MANQTDPSKPLMIGNDGVRVLNDAIPVLMERGEPPSCVLLNPDWNATLHFTVDLPRGLYDGPEKSDPRHSAYVGLS